VTTERRSVPYNYGKLREKRIGILLHWDGSGSDAGAVNWLTKHPDCRVSYNALITDDGQHIKVAPDDARAWHAGTCTPSKGFKYKDANSAFYGLAFASKSGDTITRLQLIAAVKVARQWFGEEGWPLTDSWRVTDHKTETRRPDGTHRKPDIGTGLLYEGKPLTVKTFTDILGDR